MKKIQTLDLIGAPLTEQETNTLGRITGNILSAEQQRHLAVARTDFEHDKAIMSKAETLNIRDVMTRAEELEANRLAAKFVASATSSVMTNLGDVFGDALDNVSKSK